MKFQSFFKNENVYMEELHQLIIWELEMALIFNFLDVQSSVAANATPSWRRCSPRVVSFPFCCVCRWLLLICFPFSKFQIDRHSSPERIKMRIFFKFDFVPKFSLLFLNLVFS
jgi:hypothetical protein